MGVLLDTGILSCLRGNHQGCYAVATVDDPLAVGIRELEHLVHQAGDALGTLGDTLLDVGLLLLL